MKRIFLLSILFIFLSSGAFSYEYVVTKYAGYLNPPDNQVTALTGGDWNDGYFDLPISTQFYFYGRQVGYIRIMTDGYVVFESDGPPSVVDFPYNMSIPGSAGPNGFAAPWWDDWDFTGGGSIWYETNAVFTAVEWRNVRHHDDPTTDYRFTLFLYSTTYTNAPNTIIFCDYIAGSGTGAHDNAKTGTVGIEHYSGLRGEEVGCDIQSINTNEAYYFTPFVPVYGTTNFWPDGESALAVFRPSEGAWYKRKNDGTATETVSWGQRHDIAVPGDYDHDDQADECVVRPNYDYLWYGLNPNFVIQWGRLGDIPVPADYNGDGWTDLAVFRPMSGLWFIYYRNSDTSEVIQWGTAGDIPVPADYDGDGEADCAVYRQKTGVWYIRKSADPASSWVIAWGIWDDIPVPAKNFTWAHANIGVFRPFTGMWFSYDQATAVSTVAQWGSMGDQPVPSNMVGSQGYDERVVFRPSEGNWYTNSTINTVIHWGMLGDKPRCR